MGQEQRASIREHLGVLKEFGMLNEYMNKQTYQCEKELMAAEARVQ